MSFSDIFQIDNKITGQYLLLIISALLLVAVVIFLNRQKIKYAWLNFKTRYRLNRLGFEQKVNFQWPDGLGHHFTIDRLILCQDGITLLAYKQYPGKIFCADNIDDWTQMLGQKSYRFKNPLSDLDDQIKAISANIPDVPVSGFLFFDHLAEFPKGHPDRVIYLESIPAELTPGKDQDVKASVMSAWTQLTRVSQD
jgi:hypothetical protein